MQAQLARDGEDDDVRCDSQINSKQQTQPCEVREQDTTAMMARQLAAVTSL